MRLDRVHKRLTNAPLDDSIEAAPRHHRPAARQGAAHPTRTRILAALEGRTADAAHDGAQQATVVLMLFHSAPTMPSQAVDAVGSPEKSPAARA
jgi:hypothetical protein